MTVKVDSWGDDCGHEPKSYGSNKTIEVDVVSKGPHLVFSKGGVRTDRCMSPNPRLSTISESSAPGNWKRVCQTPKNDPKFERLESNLKAQGANKLVYTGRTKFEWSLKGDHCVAFLHEKQVFVREGDDADEPPAAKKEPKPEPGCEEHGPLKRISLNPKKSVIGPGERVCFKAQGIDAEGCRFPVGASWTATQDDQEVGGLLSRGGCFSAGATAAESEGTYVITARAEGKSASAEVTVAFPDLGDLLAARLKPGEGLEGAGKADAGALPGPSTPSADGAAQAATAPIAAETGAKDNTLFLVIVVAAGMVVAVALLVLAIVLRKRTHRPTEPDDDWMEEPLDEPVSPPEPRRAAALPADPATKPTRPLREPSRPPAKGGSICPTCGEVLPEGSRFCPHDGSSLVPLPPAPKLRSESGMVCPKCHRGYDAEARFCPHDSEKLLPYREWRKQQRGNRG